MLSISQLQQNADNAISAALSAEARYGAGTGTWEDNEMRAHLAFEAVQALATRAQELEEELRTSEG